MKPSDDEYEEDEDYERDPDDEVFLSDYEYVRDCGVKGCLMMEYHYRFECHTAEDAKEYYEYLERCEKGAE